MESIKKKMALLKTERDDALDKVEEAKKEQKKAEAEKEEVRYRICLAMHPGNCVKAYIIAAASMWSFQLEKQLQDAKNKVRILEEDLEKAEDALEETKSKAKQFETNLEDTERYRVHLPTITPLWN